MATSWLAATWPLLCHLWPLGCLVAGHHLASLQLPGWLPLDRHLAATWLPLTATQCWLLPLAATTHLWPLLAAAWPHCLAAMWLLFGCCMAGRLLAGCHLLAYWAPTLGCCLAANSLMAGCPWLPPGCLWLALCHHLWSLTEAIGSTQEAAYIAGVLLTLNAFGQLPILPCRSHP